MKRYLTFCLIFLTNLLASQTPTWNWAVNINGPGSETGGAANGYDGGHACVADASGNVYITGSTDSGVLTAGTLSVTGYGDKDVFVAKIDAAGTVLWAIRAGGGSPDGGTGIGVDSSGNVYVTGFFQSSTIHFGSTTLTNTGSNSDIFIAKYSSSGNLIWANSAGTTQGDESRSIAVDAAGNSYITGYFGGSSITFGNYTITNNYFLTKYDTNGNVLWASAALTSSANPYSNTIDKNGNIYVTGMFYLTPLSIGSFTLYNDTNSGTADLFLLKYDSSGTVLWAKRAGGNKSEVAYCVTCDTSCNAIITGNSYSSTFIFGSTVFNNVSSSGTTHDIYVLKFDPNGNELWVSSAGGTNNDQGTSVTTDPAGNIYLTGDFTSNSINFDNISIGNSSNLIAEIFTVKYSPAGSAVWAKVTGGPANDRGKSIASNEFGEVFELGTYASTTIFFDSYFITNSFSATSNAYCSKINGIPLHASSSVSPSNNSIDLFPNPASETITINNLPNESEIRIFSLIGEIVFQLTAASPTELLNLRDFKPGLYNCLITSANNSQPVCIRFIVE